MFPEMIGQSMQTSEAAKRDPRRLRSLMDRAFLLMREHQVGSVFIGIAGPEGDLLVPEFIAFLESALRVEDGVFVLTRERAVLLLTDVDLEQAAVGRLAHPRRLRQPLPDRGRPAGLDPLPRREDGREAADREGDPAEALLDRAAPLAAATTRGSLSLGGERRSSIAGLAKA